MFNLLFPLWFMLTALLPLTFGYTASVRAANAAHIKSLSLGFAIRVQIWLLLVKLVLGLDVLIVSSRRTAAQQSALNKADGRNPAPNPAKPDVHMRGVAVDVNFWRNGVPVLLKASAVASWKPVYELAAICGILNGHAFKGYPDNNHFYTP